MLSRKHHGNKIEAMSKFLEMHSLWMISIAETIVFESLLASANDSKPQLPIIASSLLTFRPCL